MSERSGISEAFIGLIILPIAGNAVEHITAVYVAVRNKMDLAIAVALGSSIQISLFVIPIVVRPQPHAAHAQAFCSALQSLSVCLALLGACRGPGHCSGFGVIC